MSLGYVRYLTVQWCSERLPLGAAFGIAEGMADGWWLWSRRDRAIVNANLSRMTGRAVPGAMSRQVFRNFGRYLVEFFTMHRNRPQAVRVEGGEHLEAARREGEGVIVLTGHLGNWELGAVCIRGMGKAMSVVALPHADPRLDRLFNDQRRRCALEVIPVGTGAAQRSLAALRRGELVGLLGDWEFGRRGVPLPFLGGTSTLPDGPALLSLRSGAPVVPSFLLREPGNRFRLCFEPPIRPERHGAVAETVTALTRAYAAVLERYIHQEPTQWLMFQPVT